MRKRPRTTTSLDVPSTSAFTLSQQEVSHLSPRASWSHTHELFVTRTPLDDALAQIDVALGIMNSSLPTLDFTKAIYSTIEDELDAVLHAIREEQTNESETKISVDTLSRVSSSSVPKAIRGVLEDCSPTPTVLRDLHALDSKCEVRTSYGSITVTSPPLVKTACKRRRSRWHFVNT